VTNFKSFLTQSEQAQNSLILLARDSRNPRGFFDTPGAGMVATEERPTSAVVIVEK